MKNKLLIIADSVILSISSVILSTAKNLSLALSILFIASCAIKDDIPYPIVEGNIEAMEVEGQCDANGNSSTQATISKTNRTVTLYVDDTVNKEKVRITKLKVSNDAIYTLTDKTVCNNAAKFPNKGFESLSELTLSTDTRLNFSEPVEFCLSTYQDYLWTVTVEQIIKREVVVENQVGEAVVDPISRQVVIYVTETQPLNKVKVSKFNIGGQHGTVVPNPADYETYDFSGPTKFLVSHGWENLSQQWTVYVYQKRDDVSLKATVFPMAVKAYMNGTVVGGKQPTIEYREKGNAAWTTLSAFAIDVQGTKYTAELTGLQPGTEYEYRITVDNKTGAEYAFTTAPAVALPNGSLDDWHQTGRLWNPWKQGADDDKFWDTGNRGATTVGESNSVPTTETSTGSGMAAQLQSKWIVLKFAAGNIFTGEYLRTVGTNGELSFGRPFNSFPTKLRFQYKYNCSKINRVGIKDEADEYYTQMNKMKGQPDTANVYIALADWDEPLIIKTRPSERQLFDRNDPHIIAFAELLQGKTVENWTQVDLTLKYRYKNRTPKYILIVASSSKYGDFFTGGDESLLCIDNFELLYE